MEHKVALVTGGSAGIGHAICDSLLAAGYEVVSLDRTPPERSHPRFHPMPVDLLSPAETHDAALDAAERWRPTTLVHNAGAMRPALLAEVKREDLDALVSLHLGAAITLVQATLPAMREDGFGRVVLVSSRAALGLATRTSYSATKAGMIGMARTWALELGPLGVTVNVIAPGPIETDMFRELLPEGDPRIEAMVRGIPVRRVGQPADIARTVLFFADPAAGFITGQTLFVDGGTSVGGLTI
jgi:NAD(P)-dependent dehydrogenase (short-subunit alcohol dehydrogenase family)